VGHTSRSSGSFRVEAIWGSVSQSVLKTDGDAMVGTVNGTIVEVASRSS
jgi:hypothetical protein